MASPSRSGLSTVVGATVTSQDCETKAQRAREVALLGFQEKNSVLHTIRARVLAVQAWYCGGAMALAAWSFSEAGRIPTIGHIAIAIGVALSGAAVGYMIRNDEIGFDVNRRVLVDIEENLGFYDVNLVSENGPSIYPQAWKATKGRNKRGRFFRAIYITIGLFSLFALAAQLYLACQASSATSPTSHRIQLGAMDEG